MLDVNLHRCITSQTVCTEFILFLLNAREESVNFNECPKHRFTKHRQACLSKPSLV